MRRFAVSNISSQEESLCSRSLPQLLSCNLERPRLLAGLAFGGDEAGNSIRAHVVEANRSERIHERIRVLDLARELWPGTGVLDGACRSLRSLSDSSKQNFLLRVSGRAVWLRTDFVRAVVEQTRVTFLDGNTDAFAAFIDEFRRSTRSRMPSEDGFRCWTVECIICAAVTLHSMRLQVLRPVAESMLENVRNQAFNCLLKLYPLKTALTTYIEQMRPLVHGLKHVLQIEEDTPCESECSDAWVCTALEDVLYVWSRTAEELMDEAATLSANIEDKMRFEEASMSCTRNQLIRFELWSNIATVALGLGSLLSGVFGMNLDNHGLDTLSGMFYVVSGGIIGGMAFVVGCSLWVIARSLRHYNDHAPCFGNNRFFRRIGDDYYVLSLSSSLPSGPGRLNGLVRELSEKALPQQESAAACCRRRPRQAPARAG